MSSKESSSASPELPSLGEADVIVVGGGGAGLAATVTAAGEGASVILLEKNPHLGGTTSIAVGSYTAAKTSIQQTAGIEDDFEEHVEDMLEFAGKHRDLADTGMHRVLARQAAETFEWLRSLGIQFVGPFPEPPNRVSRMHNVIPTAKVYVSTLQPIAQKAGARIFVNTEARSLLTDGDGRVIGVECNQGRRTGKFLADKGVILAAGDYSNSYELKSQFVDEEAAQVEGINPTATGDGHLMGMSIGAQTLNMGLLLGPQIRFVPPPRRPFAQILPTNPAFARLAAAVWKLVPKFVFEAYVKSLLVTWTAPEPPLYDKGAILVNTDGRRFVDETGPRREREIPNQPEKRCYIVFDNQVADQFSEWPNFISTAPDIAYAYVKDYKTFRRDLYHESGSVDGLAGSLGMDAVSLQATIEEVNASAGEGKADSFGRHEFAGALREPPFYALGPAKAWIVHSDGGLRVDEDCRVFGEEGQVIEGLYAAGSNGQSGLILWGHGLHIAWAFTSGRIAARAAAGARAGLS